MKLMRLLVAACVCATAGAQSAAAPTTLNLNLTCMASYGSQSSTGTLDGTCNGLVAPFGGVTAALSLRAALNADGEPQGASGTLRITLINSDIFVTSLIATSLSKNSQGGLTIRMQGNIDSGSGRLDKATGSLQLSVDGVPQQAGTALVSIGGGGSISAPALPAGPAVPVGPGPLGDPLASSGTSCGAPVTVSNGNMYHQFVDAVLNGRGLRIVLVRTYNSQGTAVPGSFGYGWTHSYSRQLYDGGATILYPSESGGSYVFAQSGDAYTTDSVPGLRLVRETRGYTVRWRNGFEERFDAYGRLASTADRSGNEQELTYDTLGRILTISDGSGAGLWFQYDAAGRVTGLQDHAGRQLSYVYDEIGNLASSTNQAGQRTSYAYYSESGRNHHLKQITFPDGSGYAYEYDARGATVRTAGLGGGLLSYLYEAGRTTVTDGRGAATSFEYNSQGNPIRITGADGAVVQRAWSSTGRLVSETDAAGFTTTFAYDVAGRLLTRTDALGQQTSYAYDPVSGKISSFTDAGGFTTNYAYDSNGNLERLTDPLGRTKSYTYDAHGQPLTVTDAEGRSVSYAYDAKGALKEMRDGGGLLVNVTTDDLRRAVSTKDASGRGRENEYDALDRVVKSVDSGLGTATYSYDSAGNIASVTTPSGASLGFRYDLLQNLTELTDSLGAVTSYGYTPADCNCAIPGLLTSVQDARGKVTRLEYDLNGRLLAAIDPLGTVERFTWDARGDLASYTDANGATTSYERDELGRLVRENPPDGNTRSYAWDARNNVVSAVNENAALTFTYDETGAVTSVTDSRGPYTVSYARDSAGRRTSMTDPGGGVTTYSYDDAGRIAAVADPNGRVFAFSYGDERLRKGVSYPNGLVSSITYDAAERVTGIAYGSAAQFGYTYGADGNRATFTDLAGTHSYQYDSQGQLTAAAHPTAAEVFAYDAASNRVEAGQVYDDANRLVSAGDLAFSYDNAGNLTSRTEGAGTTYFEYDSMRHLTGVTLPDGAQVRYKYDALGHRIEKEAGGQVTRYVYDGDRVLLEVDGGGATQARYTFVPGTDEPLALERGADFYTYVLDGSGNVVALADAGGGLAQTYAYSAFGQPAGGGNTTVANPFQFASREYDSETGLYHFRVRAYDPRTGRFLQKDPVDLAALQSHRAEGATGSGEASAMLRAMLTTPITLHPYVFAANNPVSFTDSSGGMFDISALFPVPQNGSESIVGAALGTMIPSFPTAPVVPPFSPGVQTLVSMLPAPVAQMVTTAFSSSSPFNPGQGSVNALVQNITGSAPAEGASCSSGGGTSDSPATAITFTHVEDMLTQAQALAASSDPKDQVRAQQLVQNLTQMMTLITNISKAQHDSIMTIIRNMRS